MQPYDSLHSTALSSSSAYIETTTIPVENAQVSAISANRNVHLGNLIVQISKEIFVASEHDRGRD
jgi:hypothetical protein